MSARNNSHRLRDLTFESRDGSLSPRPTKPERIPTQLEVEALTYNVDRMKRVARHWQRATFLVALAALVHAVVLHSVGASELRASELRASALEEEIEVWRMMVDAERHPYTGPAFEPSPR